jgi:heme A synthase
VPGDAATAPRLAPAPDAWLQRLSLAALAFTVAVIVWGAFVRASGSGAGCGAHWPTCNGEVLPLAPSLHTVIEFTHRTTSALAGLVAVGLALLAWRRRPPGHPARRWSLGVVGFMLLEGAAGAALVKLELVANDASANRAVAMSVHLMITFGLLATMTGLAWRTGPEPRPGPPASDLQRGLLALALALVALVGVSGAVAALGDTLVQQSVSSPVVDALVRLRIVHPLVAVLAAVGVLLAASTAWGQAHTRAWAVAAMAVLGLQVVAGLVNVILQAPVWMQLVHVALADAVWVTLWSLSFAGRRPERR